MSKARCPSQCQGLESVWSTERERHAALPARSLAAAAKALQGHLTFWSPLTLFATIDLSYYCTVTYSYNIDQHGGLSIV